MKECVAEQPDLLNCHCIFSSVSVVWGTCVTCILDECQVRSFLSVFHVFCWFRFHPNMEWENCYRT